MNKSNAKNYNVNQNASGEENDLSQFRDNTILSQKPIINVQIDGNEMQNQEAFGYPTAAINYCDASNSPAEE